MVARCSGCYCMHWHECHACSKALTRQICCSDFSVCKFVTSACVCRSAAPGDAPAASSSCQEALALHEQAEQQGFRAALSIDAESTDAWLGIAESRLTLGRSAGTCPAIHLKPAAHRRRLKQLLGRRLGLELTQTEVALSQQRALAHTEYDSCKQRPMATAVTQDVAKTCLRSGRQGLAEAAAAHLQETAQACARAPQGYARCAACRLTPAPHASSSADSCVCRPAGPGRGSSSEPAGELSGLRKGTA